MPRKPGPLFFNFRAESPSGKSTLLTPTTSSNLNYGKHFDLGKPGFGLSSTCCWNRLAYSSLIFLMECGLFFGKARITNQITMCNQTVFQTLLFKRWANYCWVSTRRGNNSSLIEKYNFFFGVVNLSKVLEQEGLENQKHL